MHGGVPFLGICLGLQILFRSSEEAGQLQGLNLLPGIVCALPPTVKLPHMGWNQVARKRESSLLSGIDAGAYFYFAHSYAALDAHDAAAATCAHGTEFTAIIQQRNIHPLQFHPTKNTHPPPPFPQHFLT